MMILTDELSPPVMPLARVLNRQKLRPLDSEGFEASFQ